MAEIYEIYADEAWTHGGNPLNRYWRFYGGIFGQQSDLDRLDTQLRNVIARHGVRGEVKWTKLSEQNYNCYIDLVDTLFEAVRCGGIKYRQMFLDRSYVRVPRHRTAHESELTIQFKLYYQFLKHAFGLQYLPQTSDGGLTYVLIRLDGHTSRQHTSRLETFASELPHILSRLDLSIRVTFHNSKKMPRLQICDLLMGAAGSYGNRMHKKRRPSQRGMTRKQRLRFALCKHIYDGLRAIDAEDRGSRAFNWFETTGLGGSRENLFNNKVRIWKFVPRSHVRDRGWEKDHLDSQWNYRGPDIEQP